jgi:ERCC4-type nuclease
MALLPKVLFDIREQNSGYLIYLKNRTDLPFLPEIVQLSIGDVQPSDDIVIEIKRIAALKNPFQPHANHDLLSSLFDNRLYDQAAERQAAFKTCIVIIEVEPGASFFNKSFGKEAWKNVKASLELQYNQHIWFSTGFDETTELISLCVKKALEGEHYHDPTNKDKRPAKLIDQQRYFLSGLLDIGKNKSLELIQRFKTPWAVILWIIKTKLEHTKSGKPKLAKDSVDVAGFGPLFFEKNQTMLTTEDVLCQTANQSK